MKNVLVLLAAIVSPLTAAPLFGTKSIGPTGDYTSIAAAIAAVQIQTLSGPIALELQQNYVPAVETFPLTFGNLPTSAANTLTIRPKSGAINLSISSAVTTAATVDLNGARFVTFDGRPGGLGTAKMLTIANTSTGGVAVRFINEASDNTLRHLTLQGENTSATSGTVVFSNTTGANGNDNNTIDTCDLRDGATLPANALYSLGSAGTTVQNNSGNTVSNCNVFNFHSEFNDAAGVRLDNGNTGWSITGNSYYQTAARLLSSGYIRPIYINSGSGSQFTVSGNFIGGRAPNAGGSPWTTTGGTNRANIFEGIKIETDVGPVGNVQGNTLRNFVWDCTGSVPNIPHWTGISFDTGSIDNGTVANNTIGSSSGTGSISVTASSIRYTVYGIRVTTGGQATLSDNNVGSISTNASLVGIEVNSHTVTIAGNTVGSTTSANSLSAGTPAEIAQISGIVNSGDTATITGNTVTNLHNHYAGASNSGQLSGIVSTTFSKNTVTNNTVRNLSTMCQSGGLANMSSVIGILASSSSSTVFKNAVHSLSNMAFSANVGVTGIYCSGGALTGKNVIASNLVYGLAIASSGTSSGLYGMYFGSGTFTARNNMVSVGLGSGGLSTAGASTVVGIMDDGGTAGRNFYHNTVFVGGAQVSGASITYGFYGGGVSNARDFRNNIFVNARGNSGASGKHYAVRYAGSTANPTGLKADSNIFFVSGIGGVVGRYNNIDITTLAKWQAATGQDVSSAVTDPKLVNPTGVATDLHVQPNNPAEGAGMLIASVTDDFDGQARSGLTPVDIGADAGNFTSSSGDVFAPAIRFPLLSNGTTANRVLTGWCGILDNSGTVSGGSNTPRLYFKKSTDVDIFGIANDSSGNGWKYVTGDDEGNGSYSFTIDYTLINGGSVSVGDLIQYFVVAQDTAGNLGSSPATASASASPAVLNISSKPSSGVFSYNIVAPLTGTWTVGPGGNYSTLTNTGGLFAALNSGVLEGDLTVDLIGDIAETGSTVLNAITANSFPSPPVTIQPSSATMRTISGMIRLSGAQRVTIDGSFGGNGRYLTFRAGTSATFQFINDASNNTIRNCVIEGAQNNSNPDMGGVIFFGRGVTTGNDNNILTDNQIRDRNDVAGVPLDLVYSSGTSDEVANSNNSILNNDMFNFINTGVVVSGGNESWNISGNRIYQTAVRSGSLTGIYCRSLGNNTIGGNTVSDLTTSGFAYGIRLFSSTGSTAIVDNRVWNIGNTAGGLNFAYGIQLSSGSGQTVTLVNNMVAISTSGTSARNLYGIVDYGSTGSTLLAAHNTVLVTGTGSAGNNTWAFARTGKTNATVKNNVFLNLRTGGGNHFAANYWTASTGSLTMDSNVYAGTGSAIAGNFFDSGIGSFSSGTPISYAQWQVNVPTDTHSSAGNPGGNFTSAMFVDPANGNLHLVPTGNVLVNNTGTPIAGVTTDCDGDTRSLTAPDIGADELRQPFQQWAQANGVGDGPNSPGANGLANLLNFSFGLNPTAASRNELSHTGNVITPGGSTTQFFSGTPTAKFIRRADYVAAGLTYNAQFSADLSNWETDNTTPAVLATDGVNEVVGLNYPLLSGGAQARFFRLVVGLQ